jgi:hypothetical protein
VSPTVRYIVAAVLLIFAWKGAELEVPWPPQNHVIDGEGPPKELLVWADELRPIVKTMLPKDRIYLENLYDSMAFVVMRDETNAFPVLTDTGKFVNFHAGTLGLAIDRANVGKYPGLGEAIDAVFFKAAGPELKPLDKDVRTKLVAACGVLSWTFGIHRDE